MLDDDDLFGVGGVWGVGEVEGRATVGKGASRSDPSSSVEKCSCLSNCFFMFLMIKFLIAALKMLFPHDHLEK
jgi:hypothetical protein